MKLNQAVSKRLLDLLSERNMTQYRLYILSGVPKSTINNIILSAQTKGGSLTAATQFHFIYPNY